MSDRRTLAIIGLGSRIAGVCANLLDTGAPLDLVGYADPEPVGAEALSGRGHDPGQGFAGVDEMLARLRPDHVMIGSPDHLHLEHLEAALASGAHVFCEKPVVITPEETWRAAELLREHGQERFLVGLVLRSSPLFRRVMAAIDAGRIGEVVSMEANEILAPSHGAFLMRDWRRYRRYCGSFILEKCCHDIDLYQALCGSRVARVASFGGRGIFTPEHAADFEAERERYASWPTRWEATDALCDSDADTLDHQVAIMECENGARISFQANTHGAWHQRRWLVCGHRGTVEADLATGVSRIQRPFGEPETESPPPDAPGHYGADVAMAGDLRAAWFDDVPFPVPTRAALEAGLAAMAMDRAQREGGIVDLGDWWARVDGALAPLRAGT